VQSEQSEMNISKPDYGRELKPGSPETKPTSCQTTTRIPTPLIIQTMHHFQSTESPSPTELFKILRNWKLPNSFSVKLRSCRRCSRQDKALVK